ncbi:hypothetical protein BN85411320 [Alteracholeplasma palmae J233]|uniref:Uncharacterized protein n=1 Tax=Alteracholeplasma palmae (strain ATCC 49389 / J233) TaxID=1318466 RepID=U4KLB8_ALTPJ|nr:hypothetical protein [Alteracholeplasma palmae]CCV64709.1 hypothetical protein BN85411320 [Alteracholeplasma palmae J233]
MKQQYIHFDKRKNTYEWQYQPQEFYQIKEKIKYIKNKKQWQRVRDLYIKLKNENTNIYKKSRSIFAETVDIIYSRC